MNLVQKAQKGSPKKSHHQYVQSIINILGKCSFPGLIIELGVAHGRNAVIIGNLIKALKLDTKYVGFDTFSGYTPEDMDNKALKDIQRRGVWNTTRGRSKRRLRALD